MKKIWLASGLGNPEGRYFGTWHNLGFWAAELLAGELGAEFKKQGNMMIGKAGDVFVQKPLTYMNRSGEAVVAIKRKYKIAGGKILIFVDDLYIDKGKIKIIRGGTSGHNGLRSIKEHLGSDEYIRIKIGVKPEKPLADLASYVLARVPDAERPIIDESIRAAVDAAKMLIAGESLEIVQGRYNTRQVKNDKE